MTWSTSRSLKLKAAATRSRTNQRNSWHGWRQGEGGNLRKGLGLGREAGHDTVQLFQQKLHVFLTIDLSLQLLRH